MRKSQIYLITGILYFISFEGKIYSKQCKLYLEMAQIRRSRDNSDEPANLKICGSYRGLKPTNLFCFVL